jgi:hypothetical protein
MMIGSLALPGEIMKLGLRLQSIHQASAKDFLWMADALTARYVQIDSQALESFSLADLEQVAELSTDLPVKLSIYMRVDTTAARSIEIDHSRLKHLSLSSIYLNFGGTVEDPRRVSSEVVRMATTLKVPVVVDSLTANSLEPLAREAIEANSDCVLAQFVSIADHRDVYTALQALHSSTASGEMMPGWQLQGIELDAVHPVLHDVDRRSELESLVSSVSLDTVDIILYGPTTDALVDGVDRLYRVERQMYKSRRISEELWG